jgi:hypothetical protein
VRSVERVCEGEPGAECFVVGRLDAYIMGFKRCGTSKEKDQGKSGRCMNSLEAARVLTCKIISLRHVILCEERAFEVVHKEESKETGVTRPAKKLLEQSKTYCACAKGVAPTATKSM